MGSDLNRTLGVWLEWWTRVTPVAPLRLFHSSIADSSRSFSYRASGSELCWNGISISYGILPLRQRELTATRSLRAGVISTAHQRLAVIGSACCPRTDAAPNRNTVIPQRTRNMRELERTANGYLKETAVAATGVACIAA